jgi:hypothetical protein
LIIILIENEREVKYSRPPERMHVHEQSRSTFSARASADISRELADISCSANSPPAAGKNICTRSSNPLSCTSGVARHCGGAPPLMLSTAPLADLDSAAIGAEHVQPFVGNKRSF